MSIPLYKLIASEIYAKIALSELVVLLDKKKLDFQKTDKKIRAKEHTQNTWTNNRPFPVFFYVTVHNGLMDPVVRDVLML